MSWRTKLGIALVAFVLPLPALADEVRIVHRGDDNAEVALPNPQPIHTARVTQSPSVFGSPSANDIKPVQSANTTTTTAGNTTSTYSASFHGRDSVRVGVGLGVGVGAVYGPGYYAAPSAAYVAPGYCAPGPYYSYPTAAVYYRDPYYCYPSYRAGFYLPRIGFSFFGRFGHGLRLGFRF